MKNLYFFQKKPFHPIDAAIIRSHLIGSMKCPTRIFGGLMALLATSSISLCQTTTNTVNAVVPPMEINTDNGNKAYSDWMYTVRKGDPLASTGSKIYFREKRVAVDASVSPDALNIGNNTNNISAEQNRSRVRVITRYREIPFEQQLPNSTFEVDLTGGNTNNVPQTLQNKPFFFKPLGLTGSANVDLNTGKWVSNQNQTSIPAGNMVVNLPSYAPWVADQNGTLLNQAIQLRDHPDPKTVYGVVLINRDTRQALGYGKFAGMDFTDGEVGFNFYKNGVKTPIQGGIIVNLTLLGYRFIAKQPAGMRVMLIASFGSEPDKLTNKMSRIILRSGASALEGQTQVVTDSYVILVGDMSSDAGVSDARLQIFAPNFCITSPLATSLDQLYAGAF
jgi:hypothetical protein